MKQLQKLMVQTQLLIYFVLFATNISAQNLLDPSTQPQFSNPLPIPAVIDARNGGQLSIDITQFSQSLGLVNPTTRVPLLTKVWGYNGTYPGPTILARKNVPINVFWNNKLVDASKKPLPHLLPIDVSIDWAFSGNNAWQKYGVPIVTHLHGGHTESASDGLPNAWFTPNFTSKGSDFIKGDKVPYTYSNTQQAATLWYHDHTMGITRLNAYAGLAGFYIITDDSEANLVRNKFLPSSPYDIGLAIQDKSFTADGHLYYPSTPDVPGAPSPSILPESFGNIILVNGMAWPVLDVEPRQYRFRVLNASDSRFYDLFISSSQPIIQIGSDDGLLPSPVTLPDMLIAPGERKDVIIDFSNPALWGQTIIVRNIAKVPYPRGSTVDPNTTGKIIAFRVNKSLSTVPLTTLPSILRSPITRLTNAAVTRQLILFESTDEFGRLKPMLGTYRDGVLPYNRPVTENPAINTTEVWEIYNETADAHPIHLHQVSMQLINRQKFSATIDPVTGKPANVKLTGSVKPPLADEAGWKDTYVMYPGEVTRVITHFDLPGKYVWHCHILSHEDHEMMRPFYVGTGIGTMYTRSEVEVPAQPSFDELKVSTIPNPFTNTLKLELALNKTAMINIALYDTKGSKVQQIFQGERPIGIQQFLVSGSKLTNGTYICEIVVNDKRIVRKLVLQK
jgi:spore coat protein A, manganese oxidase